MEIKKSINSRRRPSTKRPPKKTGHDRAEANRFEHLRDQNTKKKLEKSLGGTKKTPAKPNDGTKTAKPGGSGKADPRKGTPESGFDRAENNRFQTISDTQSVDNSHQVAENNRFQTISDTQQSDAKTGLAKMMEALKAQFEQRTESLNEQSQATNGYRAVYQ